MAEKENIITKEYDLIKYLIPLLSKFPRDEKYLVADRIENQLLNILELLITAYYSSKEKKTPILQKINIELEKTRYLIRLTYDFKYINVKRYEIISTKINELGTMIGGWLKSLKT